ncbi:MAG: patatin family protein, partial [Clostridia bacterium]|nr:patatin family protein [Clostridia bacterium]
SMSMPAFFQPAHLNGRTSIDGGVVNRVPVDVLRRRGMDVVVGVDVGYRGEEESVASMNFYQLMNRSIDIMQWEIAKLRLEQADVMIVPAVRQYIRGHFQMDMIDRTVEEGRRAAEAALPAIEAARRPGWRSLIGLSGR